MLAKVLAGVLAAGAMAGGGYVYLHHGHGCCPLSGGNSTSCPAQPVSVSMPPCCQQPSRTDYPSTDVSCCRDEDPATPEVLAIQPREVQ